LTLVDEYTREWLVLHAAGSMTGADVRRIMGRVVGRRGSPTRVRSDNGSEFICEALTNWWKSVGSDPIPVEAASPWQNGFIESFDSRLRDEFLERVEFESVADARAKGGGSVGNTTRSGRTVRSATRRRESSARSVTGRIRLKTRSVDRYSMFVFVDENFHLEWTKKRGAAHSAIPTSARKLHTCSHGHVRVHLEFPCEVDFPN
jgi:transposase InsO family protein